MKTLILVRHAKSSWKYDVSDRERGLKTRGIEDAHNVVTEFLSTNEMPDTIFCSPAKRAQDTCKIFLNGARKPNLKPEIKEALYDFSGSSVIEFIKKLPNHLNKVLLFGHNYAFTHIANTYGHLHLSNLPTSGLVVINFDIMDWNDLKKGKTQSIIIPKTLRNG